MNPQEFIRHGNDVLLNGEFFEPYRLDTIFLFGIGFIILTVLIAGKRGLSSLIGLVVTLIVITQWILPGILSGGDPLWLSVSGSALIAASSLYLAHGFKPQTTISVISTLATLFLAFILGWASVKFAHLEGMGSEAANLLMFGATESINLQGLLLGAILIGTLGILDDVTTTQTATISELKKANKKYQFKELWDAGLNVGREHIASLINTLVLAYVGAAFPVLVLIATSDSPLWVTFNNETLAEEIIRTLVGSSAVVLAVPISTALAAWAYGRKN